MSYGRAIPSDTWAWLPNDDISFGCLGGGYMVFACFSNLRDWAPASTYQASSHLQSGIPARSLFLKSEQILLGPVRGFSKGESLLSSQGTEFEPQDFYVGRQELTPVSCPQPSLVHPSTCMSVRRATHIHSVTEISPPSSNFPLLAQ